MRIGMMVSFGIGGADKSSYYLAEGLKELGHDVVIFYTDMSFPKVSPQWDSDYEMLSRFDSYKNFESHHIKDVNDFNNHGIDVLNSHRSGEDLWLIPGFEQGSFYFPIVETNFHGELHTKADYRVFPSQTLVNFKKLSIPHSVIFNPIMPKLTNDNLREELGIPNDAFVFGKISRASNEIFTPITYLAYKKVENPNAYFIQMGINKATEEIAAKLNLKNFIAIDQTLDEVRISKFYNTFDLYCHGNKLGETFGNTVAEAMMHGKPVITHLGDSSWPQAQCEVIGREDNIIRRQDVHAYVEYSNLMNDLMHNVEKYNEFQSYCMDRATNFFEYKAVAKKYSDLFEKVLSS
jgi:glycosyltransferase involved in cell wall biosynthesis